MTTGTSRAGSLARLLLAVVVTVMSGAWVGSTPASAQIPDEFTNLQFFPEDIAQRELVGIMRNFTRATGLRCSGCHVGEEGLPLATYDFATDDKPEKVKARAMLEMVRDINENHLASLPGRSQPNVAVNCMTCHGGIRRPVPLQAELRIAMEDDGTEGAIARYRELRDRYHGSRAFDFGEGSLRELSEELAGEERLDAALAMIDLNLEFNPESEMSHLQRGEVLRQQDDTEAALAAYQRVLEINPENPVAQRRIEQLSGGG